MTTRSAMLEGIDQAYEILTEERAEICRGWPDGIVPSSVREQLNAYDDACRALNHARNLATKAVAVAR